MYAHSMIIALAAMMVITPALAFADVEDYIKAVCEDYDGKWSDENMACNDFESVNDQVNFGDSLMDRDTYDEKVEQCDEKGGTWSDEDAKCTILDDEERAAYEDVICDDGSCNKKIKYDDTCFYEGEKVERGDYMYQKVCD
jgi:hypothetical protein